MKMRKGTLLTYVGLVTFLLGTSIILTFVIPAQLYFLAPGAEDAWKYVKVKGILISNHTEVFMKYNITKYEGSKTCIQCHKKETKDFVHSIHYKMWNYVNDIVGKPRVKVGSRVLYNDFCGAIFWNMTKPINFIGKTVLKNVPNDMEKLKGRVVSTGCSACHGSSLGKVPNIEPNGKDLENVDCLVCHSLKYRGGPLGVAKGYRKLVKTEDGWRYVPDISIKDAALILAKPGKDSCLACHAYSGGGPGFKRPNLTPDLMGNVSEHFDVHMARGLHCVDCHPFEDHKVATKAVDTFAREGKAKSCVDCHPHRHRAPIVGFFIERFHKRVSCQACHIPYIAHGKYPTDVKRDWRKAEFNYELKRWEPEIELKRDVVPTYAWWDGRDRIVYPDKVTGNEIIFAKPVKGKNAKIYPFKVHISYVPIDKEKGVPIPIKVGIVFSTGNVTLAIKKGAEIAGLNYTGNFIKVVRYMSVDHGVVPAKEALKCTDCHSPWTRMPLKELGYGPLPEIAYYGAPLLVLAGLALTLFSILS
ncbi:hypothetical protein IPA_02710 [Ignicoccus pacificus DSM 13166]|uniref:Cytochrome c7-like domain-containing protein n=1 Tax=Ignicoccus pacificus DSM 13166 TaxID=940294 RepID=A0A977KA83_9CREN|nr:hypothetical protein IPA_02710 [Ignicoccus pacificus DSM 13166]